MSILLGEPLVPFLAYTMVRAVVDATEIIRYIKRGLTGHLNDVQTFGLICRIRTELFLPEQYVFLGDKLPFW